MDIELKQKQAEIIDQLVHRASSCKVEAVGPIIIEATSHPSLFAFSEILALPNVAQLEGTTNSVYLDMLRLFARGTWSNYRCKASRIPQLAPDQILKLKQLTVITLANSLAESDKVQTLSNDTLMVELDVTNVRELEYFLINDCMNTGIVRGYLDQLNRCFKLCLCSKFAEGVVHEHHARSDISVLWDLESVKAPSDFDPLRYGLAIETSLKKLGYRGGISITAYSVEDSFTPRIFKRLKMGKVEVVTLLSKERKKGDQAVDLRIKRIMTNYQTADSSPLMVLMSCDAGFTNEIEVLKSASIPRETKHAKSF